MSKGLSRDEFFMRRALELGKKGFGKVEPNPMVGAVLVKNGKILSESYHQYFGGPHAEVNVLKKMTPGQIRGATMYITLEPCCHFGKTPPCTNFLIKKGLKDLVMAMRDPNPLVAGRGILQLKKAGIRVREGVLEEEAQKLYKGFPWVSIKIGMSADGKITGPKILPGGITNKLTQNEVHRMRAKADALLTTSQTVINDNPHLGVRLVKGKDPLRIIIDSKLRTALSAKVYRDKNVLIATTTQSPAFKRKKFQKKGFELLVYEDVKVPLKKLLKNLFQRGIFTIMVEAGSGLVTSLIVEKLADDLTLFIAPKILKSGLPWIQKKSLHLSNVQIKNFGDDLIVYGALVY